MKTESQHQSDQQPDGSLTRLGKLPVEAHNAVTVGTLLLAVIIYEVIARFGFPGLDIIFPSVIEVAEEFVWLFQSQTVYPHFVVTMQTVLIASTLAAVVGIIGGLSLGANKFAADAVEPLLYYFSSLPKITLYPLFLVALGVGIESRVVAGFLSALFPITVNCITGALSVKEQLVRVGEIYRVSRWQLLKFVYIPSTITHIINGLRLGVAGSLLTIVLAELFASQGGLGNRVGFFFSNLQTARMYATILFLFVLSLIINFGFLYLQQYLARRGYGVEESGADDSVLM